MNRGPVKPLHAAPDTVGAQRSGERPAARRSASRPGDEEHRPL